MKPKDITFSKNIHDRDGDVYCEGIFLHFGENTIIKVAENNQEFLQFVEEMKEITKQLIEYYPDE